MRKSESDSAAAMNFLLMRFEITLDLIKKNKLNENLEYFSVSLCCFFAVFYGGLYGCEGIRGRVREMELSRNMKKLWKIL